MVRIEEIQKDACHGPPAESPSPGPRGLEATIQSDNQAVGIVKLRLIYRRDRVVFVLGV